MSATGSRAKGLSAKGASAKGARTFAAGAGWPVLLLALGGSAGAAEGEFMRDAMSGIGLIEPDRPAITYNERAPLAMPPSLGQKPAKPVRAGRAGKPDPRGASASADPDAPLALPPPRTRQADPQWPKDPETIRRERAAIEAEKPIVRGAQGRTNDNNMTLSVDELERGRRAGAGLSDGPAGAPGETRAATWLDPFELFSGRKTEDAGPSLVEPSRDGLTDPPTGYRKAPLKVERVQGLPVGGAIRDNEEADPRAYLRSQGGR